jgi:ActR/RegA family two-component response regulator
MIHRVLVVDDDQPLCRVLGKMFRTIGWDVTEASSIATALTLLQRAPGYLVVDLELPDGSGETVVQAALAVQVPPRIVVCTGVVDRERLRAVRALGPEAVLAKPVAFADLMEVLGR